MATSHNLKRQLQDESQHYVTQENISETGLFQTKIKEIKSKCVGKEGVQPCKDDLLRAQNDLVFAKKALLNTEKRHVTETMAKTFPLKYPDGPSCVADNPLGKLRRKLIQDKKIGPKKWKSAWPKRCPEYGYFDSCPFPPDMKDASIDIMGCHDAIEPGEYKQRLKRGTTCLKARIRGMATLPSNRNNTNIIQAHLPPLGLAYEISKGCAKKVLSSEELKKWEDDISNTIAKTARISRKSLGNAISRTTDDSWHKHTAINLDKTGKPTKPMCSGWNNTRKVCRNNSNKYK
jgi:hypothetical protein